MQDFRRGFVQAGRLRVHYRTAGSGPPVVMLHPSPLSSRAVLPVAAAVARSGCQVFALDTPGYGLSEPLPSRPDALASYLQPLADTLDALGISRCCLYGAATGAQIALEFAARHPERVTLLVMDTAGHISAERCEQLVKGYFPDVSPRADGGHLLTLWGLVRDLGVFFPWNDTRRAARIERDLPDAAAMQAMLLDYLRAGNGYDWAYRPAFYNERAERLRHCRVPALLTRWPSSIALPITDALIAEGLPSNFDVLSLGPSMAERASGIAAAVSARARDLPRAGPITAVAPSGRFASAMLDAGATQMHARIAQADSGRPLVALHGAGGAARLLEPLLAPLLTTRPVIAVDLPGHGDSEPAEDPAAALGLALDSLALPDADLLGVGLGAEVATALRRSEPARFPRLVAVDRSAPPGAPWPTLAPRLDASHLTEAWFMLRDARLWWPWHDRSARAARRAADPDLHPETLHRELVELMMCGERFAAAAEREAAWRPQPEAGPEAPMLVLHDPDARAPSGTVPSTRTEEWQGLTAASGTRIRRWLDSRCRRSSVE